MKTMYYSEKLDKHFETKEECIAAEKAFDEEQDLSKVAATKRAKKYEEVEALGKKAEEINEEAINTVHELAEKVAEARATYLKARKEFVDEYGNYSPEEGEGDGDESDEAALAAFIKFLLS